MPLKNGHLTAKERAFVKHYSTTGDDAYAAHKAGYADSDRIGRRIIARPEVANAVRAAQAKIIENHLLPMAVQAHERILKDAIADKPTMSPKVHLDAIKVAYSYTIGRNADAAEKAPEDMTAEEIAARLAELRAQQQRFLEGIPDAEIVEDTTPGDDVFG